MEMDASPIQYFTIESESRQITADARVALESWVYKFS